MTSIVSTDKGTVVGAQTRRWIAVSRNVAYWIFTMLVAYEMVAGGFWDLLGIKYVREVLAHLGYPMYLLFIIGIGKIPCAAALLARGFPRLREWAYAGAFFNYWGAMASHFAVGDPAGKWLGPLFFVAFTVLSRALLPEERTTNPPSLRDHGGLRAWLTPALLLGGLAVFSLVTLPHGSP